MVFFSGAAQGTNLEETPMAKETRQFFANAIAPLERDGPFVRVTFCLRATHGRHAGEMRPVVRVVLTPMAIHDLVGSRDIG